MQDYMYILENKPLFSINEFRNLTYFDNTDPFGLNLIKLAKQKLNI